MGRGRPMGVGWREGVVEGGPEQGPVLLAQRRLVRGWLARRARQAVTRDRLGNML